MNTILKSLHYIQKEFMLNVTFVMSMNDYHPKSKVKRS